MLRAARAIQGKEVPYRKPTPTGPVVLCRECEKFPIFDQISSCLCETCWSVKARQWFASGLRRNAFHHQVRR